MNASEGEGLDPSDVALVRTDVGIPAVYLESQILDSGTGVDDIGDVRFIHKPIVVYHYVADGIPE